MKNHLMKSHIDAFITYLEVERGSSAHTRGAYQRDLLEFKDFLSYTGADYNLDPELDKVKTADVSAFAANLFGRVAKSTVARKLSSIRSFFTYLLKKGVLRKNPAEFVTSPKLEKHLPTVLTVEETESLINASKMLGKASKMPAKASKTPAKASKTPNKAARLDISAALRDLAILEVLYSTGMRASELTGLKLGNVDFEGSTVRVLGKGGKERLCVLGTEASGALARYIEQSRDGAGSDAPVFIGRSGAAICSRSVQRILRKYTVLSGIAKLPTPHSLDCLVNLTNDGWFHGSSELDQHLITAAFRAVECRTPMVRAVNTGISAVIDGDGVIREPDVFFDGDNEGRQSMRDPQTGRWHKQLNAVLVDTIPLDGRASLYVTWGDWFAGSCLVCCLFLPLVGLMPRQRPAKTDAGAVRTTSNAS